MSTGVRTDPYRNFRFRVEIDGIQTASFADATIPGSNTASIDYREGTDPSHVRKLSTMNSYGNLTLKRGVTSSMELYNWHKAVMQSGAAGARKNISLILMDEFGNDKARWDIVEAWPIKYEAAGFSAKGNDVLVETIEIVNEGITRVA